MFDTPETIYERYECVDLPRHYKFYEIEVELSLFYPKVLIRRWGRINSRRHRHLRCHFDSPDALADAIDQIRRRRTHHGYTRTTSSNQSTSRHIAAPESLSHRKKPTPGQRTLRSLAIRRKVSTLSVSSLSLF